MKTTLERYYAGLGNVVLRDANGNPSIFVRHPKQNSNEFFDFLPNHPHPAFTCGEEVDTAVLISKYRGSSETSNGAVYSVPNASPVTILDYFEARDRAKLAGNNVVSMTIADYGLIKLMCAKDNISLRGNTNYGMDEETSRETGIKPWQHRDTTYKLGDKVAFRGWVYECMEAHTPNVALLPTDSPKMWKKLYKIGGTMDPDEVLLNPSDGARVLNGTVALTGSGPLDWYFKSDIALEADFAGGYVTSIADHLVRNRELIFIPNNLAADPSTDVSANSTAWRAILPHTTDDGFDWVEPGTEGTIKWEYVSNHWQLTTRDIANSEYTSGQAVCLFKDITVDNLLIPYVPYILYEYGLLPIPGVAHSTDTNSNFTLGTAKLTYPLAVFGRIFGTVGNTDRLFMRNTLNSIGNVANVRLRARERATE